jgi:hypothetical protein
MDVGRDRQHQSILPNRSLARLRWEPVGRRHIPFADAALPGYVGPSLRARSAPERERNERERLPKPIRLNVLRAPAAEQTTSKSSALKDRLDQRRTDQRTLFPRHHIQLIHDPKVIALEVLILRDHISQWHGFSTALFK